MRKSLILIVAATGLIMVRSTRAAEQIQLEVRETAGIERFHYPTTGELLLPAGVPAQTPFRLLSGDRTIAAQLTPLDGKTSGDSRRFSLDFGIDLQPNQTRTLRFEYGEGVSPQPPPRRGLKVERSDGKIRVRHPSLEFVVPEDLGGLLESIRVSGDEWLGGKTAGLVLESSDGKRTPLELITPAALRVAKSGPLAVVLEAAGSTPLEAGGKVGWLVKLDFPLGKSWVKVDCTLDDPDNKVRAVAAELRLRLTTTGKPPVLADVGAGDWTYAALRADASLRYRAGPPTTAAGRPNWKVERVRAGQATSYVTPPEKGQSPAPRGWAHLMDSTRATAIAVDRFAADTSDAIELAADGKLRIRREFPRGAKQPKRAGRLTFWLHVVASPPQWGAATSPQSMLAPPEVRTLGSPRSEEPAR